MRRISGRTPPAQKRALFAYIYIYAAHMRAHTPEKKQRNGIYIYIYIYIYAAHMRGAHPCVNDSFSYTNSVKLIKPL